MGKFLGELHSADAQEHSDPYEANQAAVRCYNDDAAPFDSCGEEYCECAVVGNC